MVNGADAAKVIRRNNSILELQAQPDATAKERQQVLLRWYRQHLRSVLPALIAKWERKMGVFVNEFGIKKMKTRWGTCNAEARRIWVNLELAKKPVSCLEYIIIHELTHLLERNHNERFTAIMDRHLPTWRMNRKELNSEPLANENWSY